VSAAKKNDAKKSGAKKKKTGFRLFSRRMSVWSVVFAVFYASCGVWFAGHDRAWIETHVDSWPLVGSALLAAGDRVRMISDAWGWTGHDAVYANEDPVPEGEVFYAGEPRRVGMPAPSDIKVIERGPFTIGWSPSLRHPAWVAYHVPARAAFEAGERPGFKPDREVASAPPVAAYATTGYDRGHMAPNRAIVTRFGPEQQKKTFLMSNIAPQTPALNQGPWREVEQRIADLWTARYGEIWVIVGSLSAPPGEVRETLSGTNVDVPLAYWQLIVAQDADGVRVQALLFPQTVGRNAFPVHYLVSVDELERMTGWDFLADLPDYLERPLEADLPTRLWPVRWYDAFRLMLIRCS